MFLEFSIKAKDLFLGFKWMRLQYLQTNKFCRIVEQYSQECIFYGVDKSLYFCRFFREFWISDQKIHSLAYQMLENLVTILFYSFSIKKSSLIDPCCIFSLGETYWIPRESIEFTTNIKWSQNLNHKDRLWNRWLAYYQMWSSRVRSLVISTGPSINYLNSKGEYSNGFVVNDL